MLSRLFIQNIALIDRLDISLSAGLLVITGETGAGKSILLDALHLVLGERADRDLIKNGCDKAIVEAVFDIQDKNTREKLTQHTIEIEDGQVILSRELTVAGKNTCRINGRLVGLSLLREAAAILIDIHAQNENQVLLSPEMHLDFLDSYAHNELETLKSVVSEQYHKLAGIRRQIKKNYSPDEIERRIETLKRQIEEISLAELQNAQEEDLLNAEKLILLNAESIKTALIESSHATSGADDADLIDAEGNAGVSAMQLLRNCVIALEKIKAISPEYLAVYTRMGDLYYSLEDIDFEIKKMRDAVVFDEYRQAEIEQRLDVIHNMKRKYGASITQVQAFMVNALNELDELEQSRVLAQKSDEIKLELELELYESSIRLSEKRKKQAKNLESALLKQFGELGLEKSKFKIEFQEIRRFSPNFEFFEEGLDHVEMLLSTNPGEPLKPLRKVASGGEISRIMLALKSVSAERYGCPCLVFDEIDTGISGRVAFVVGEKLMSLAKKHQVICITHSAQIAAMGDAQYLITKKQSDKNTTTGIKILGKKERVEEISRILGSEDTAGHGLAYAQDLIDKAAKVKARM